MCPGRCCFDAEASRSVEDRRPRGDTLLPTLSAAAVWAKFLVLRGRPLAVLVAGLRQDRPLTPPHLRQREAEIVQRCGFISPLP